MNAVAGSSFEKNSLSDITTDDVITNNIVE